MDTPFVGTLLGLPELRTLLRTFSKAVSRTLLKGVLSHDPLGVHPLGAAMVPPVPASESLRPWLPSVDHET